MLHAPKPVLQIHGKLVTGCRSGRPCCESGPEHPMGAQLVAGAKWAPLRVPAGMRGRAQLVGDVGE